MLLRYRRDFPLCMRAAGRCTLAATTLALLLVMLAPMKVQAAVSTADSQVFDGRQYWVVFTEGYRSGRVEASAFDVSSGSPTLVWNKNVTVSGATVDGSVSQFYLREDGLWEKIGEYRVSTDWALDILASNVPIIDSSGKSVEVSDSYGVGGGPSPSIDSVAHYPVGYRFLDDSLPFENFSALIPYGYWATLYERGARELFWKHCIQGGLCYGMSLATASMPAVKSDSSPVGDRLFAKARSHTYI